MKLLKAKLKEYSLDNSLLKRGLNDDNTLDDKGNFVKI